MGSPHCHSAQPQTIRAQQTKQIIELHTSIKVGIGWNGNDARLRFNVPNGAQPQNWEGSGHPSWANPGACKRQNMKNRIR